MNALQIIVIVIALGEIGFGLYWLFVVAPKFAQGRGEGAEHRRMVADGGLIQRKGGRRLFMMDNPRQHDHEQPQKMVNPQAFIGVTMILAGVIVIAVALIFLGDAG